MWRDYFFLASENFKHRGLRSWLTIIGIFIGIAAVVSLISLSDGLQTAITGQFASFSADTLIVQSSSTYFGPPGSSAVRKLNEHDLDLVKSVSGVKVAIPRLLRSVKLEYNGVLSFKYLVSNPEDEEQLNIIYDMMDVSVSSGRLLKLSDKGKIVIGADFAKKEEFDKEVKVGTTLKIQDKNFEVIGILEKSGNLQVNNAALVMEHDLKDALNITDEIDMIIAKVVDKTRTEEVADLIKRKIRRDRDEKIGEEDFSVQTPLQALQTINTILGILNIIVVGIATVSLIVGGVGIANTMYTSVLERTREIGVMKAVGARNSDILKLFLVESGMLGLAGGIVGAIVGLSFAFSVSFIANSALGQKLLVVSISWPLVIMSVMFAFLLGILFGVLPAMQAANLKPTRALRS